MKKMLKMVSGILVAGLLVIGMCATVFAAGSQVGQIATSDNPAFFANPDAASQNMDEATFRQLSGMTGGKVAVFNWDMGTTDNSPATVTFTPGGAPQNGQTLIVYHYFNGQWNEEGRAQGPTITINFNSWSPVALVVYTPDSAPGPEPTPGPTPGPTPSPTPSPKTGEADYLLFAALAAVLVGGIVAGVAIRKNKA